MRRGLIVCLCLAAVLFAAVQYAGVHSLNRRMLTVGIIHLKSEQGDPWHSKNVESLLSALKNDGYGVIFYAGNNIEEQIRAMRYCIRQRVDVMVVLPIEPTGWENVLSECRSAGIPVITVDRNIKAVEDSLVTVSIEADTYAEGQQVFALMDETVQKGALPPKNGKSYNIAMIEGISAVSSTENRREGFLDALLKSPRIADYTILVAERSNYHRDGGYEVMNKMLKDYAGKIDIVFAHNDEMALGAAAALEDAGIAPGKDVMIFSVDGLEAAKEALAQGRINGTVDCPPHYGKAVLQTIDGILRGQSAMLNRGAGGRVFAVESTQ